MGEEKLFRVRAVTLQNQRAFYEERTSSDLNSFSDHTLNIQVIKMDYLSWLY
jgi:hypothetical protein